MSKTPLSKMIDMNVRCIKCGAPMGKCDCWVQCSFCEWLHAKGELCANPECPGKKWDE